MVPRNLLPAVVLGLVLLSLAPRTVPAEAPADAGKVAKLIEQLGSDTYSERQKASDALDAIGSPALEALRKATKSSDAEVRKRASELVEKIEKRTENATVLAPRMVQLSYKDTPLADAVADFSAKSGYTLVLHDPDGKMKERKITLETGKVTFWNALEQFCNKSGLIDGDPNSFRFGARAGAFGAGGGFGGPVGGPRAVGGPGGGRAGVRPGAGAAAVVPDAVKKVPAKEEKKDEKKETKKEEKAEKKDDPKSDKKDTKKVEAEKPAGKAVVAPPLPPGGPPPAAIPPAPGVPPPVPVPAPPIGGGVIIINGAPGGLRDWTQVGPGQITLMAGSAVTHASDNSTAVRVRPADKKLFQLSEKEIAIVLQISPEPRIRCDNILSVAIDKAIDDNDQKLVAVLGQANAGARGGLILPGGGPGGAVIIRGGAAAGVWMPPSSNGLMHHTTVRLQKGDKESKSLKELTGSIAAQVLSDAEQMVVAEDLMKSAGKSFKGKHSGEMKILSADKQDDGSIQITFEFEFPAGAIAETQINGGTGAVAGPAGAGVPARAVAGKAPLGAPPAPGVPPPVGRLMPGVNAPFLRYAFNGLTLRDDKGNILNAMVTFNFKKGGGLVAGRRMEYIATYHPDGKDAPAPAKLVYTGRRQLTVNVPFTLKNVELK